MRQNKLLAALAVILFIFVARSDAKAGMELSCENHENESLSLTAADWNSTARGLLKTRKGDTYEITCTAGTEAENGNDIRFVYGCEANGGKISVNILATPDEGMMAYMTGEPWGKFPSIDHSMYCN